MSIILPENDTLRTVQLDRGIDVLDRGIYFFDVPTPLRRFFMNEQDVDFKSSLHMQDNTYNEFSIVASSFCSEADNGDLCHR